MINEIKEALEKATPGPWTHSRWAYGYVVTDYPLHNTIASVVEYNEDGSVHKEFDNWESNRYLIANTPTYIRYLLEELNKTNKEKSLLHEAFLQQVNLADELIVKNAALRRENTTMKSVMEKINNYCETIPASAETYQFAEAFLVIKDIVSYVLSTLQKELAK